MVASPLAQHQRAAQQSAVVAKDLHGLLRQMDPARWRDDGAPELRSRMLLLRDGLRPAAAADGEPPAEVRGRLDELARLIDDGLPAAELPAERVRAAWQELRRALVPAYERLAQALAAAQVHVPSLRPTNYARNLYHLGSGLSVIVLLRVILPGAWPIYVAGAFTALAWSVEIGRRRLPWLNKAMMTLFSPFAHPHEAWRINSATWFTTALLGLALLQQPTAATAALAVLAAGDPAAAVIGRRFGRTRLANGRSLEGSAAFVVAGAACAALTLSVLDPHLSLGARVAIAFAAAVPAAIAELLTQRVDDNLAIPWSAAAGVLALGAVLT